MGKMFNWAEGGFGKYYVRFIPIAAAEVVGSMVGIPGLFRLIVVVALYKVLFWTGYKEALILGFVAGIIAMVTTLVVILPILALLMASVG